MNNLKDIIKRGEIDRVGDHYAVFMYNKLEKITMAIYMVTNFFPEEEPLKFHIRQKCIRLMSFTMSLTNNPASLSEKEFFEVMSLMSEIDSSLRIALMSNLISEMNYSVLSEEYKKFLDLTKERRQEGVGRKIIFPKDFFEEEIEQYGGNIIKDTFDKGHSKGQERREKEYPISDKGQNKNIQKPENKKEKRVEKERVISERKNLILEIIKDKKEVTIKDIIKKIKDCSEKTVQRELIDLVKDSVVKKEGERRWSRYSIK
ncbi:hypothetical protein KKG48_03475 [Patescibacteria group bacterium]|nr:hypothetical protein [Patescibacteria group bacterium]MCG2694616.1 hypothetical protein [Candidatus Parcubacteria bacterium]